ncbi:rod shape-determining protein MreD, partial [Magnetococcales bacterium HHB-1]
IFSFIIPWTPAVTVFFALIVQELALPWHAWSFLRPDLVLIGLFYWHLYRPDLCGLGTAFLLGMVTDILSGVPLGLNAITKIFVILVLNVYGSRFRNTDFIFIPFAVTLFSLFDHLMQRLLMMALFSIPFDLAIIMGRCLATFLMTPLVIAVLIALHHRLLD